MRTTTSFVWLLLLTICCWHCTTAKEKGKTPAHSHSEEYAEYSEEAGSDSKEHSHSQEHLHSKEHSHSQEHLHSKEHSHSQEHSSHSQEHLHSKEHSHSHSQEGSSEYVDPSCADKKKNHAETDIDCGGEDCAKCTVGKKCKANSDCTSNICKNKICAQPPTKPTTTTTTTPEPTTTATTTATTTPEPTTTTATTPEPIETTEESTTTTTTPAPVVTTEESTTTTTTPEPIITTEESTTTTTTTPEPIETTEESTTTTTTQEPVETTEESTTTTTPAPVVTTEESTTTTTTPEPIETTEESTTTTTTTPEPIITTEESTTTTTTQEPIVTTEESTMKIPVCELECKNDGVCVDDNVCECTDGFSGPTCEVQSVGLCLEGETFNSEPILMITFGNGSTQYSTATPDHFDFSTTYKQRFEPVTNDGMFSFINRVHNDFNGAWHTNATDHTPDNGGYMYLVNADYKPGQFYNGRVDDLCVGLRYEFSVYLANLCKPSGKITPNVLFEVRSTDDNSLLAQLNSGNITEHSSLTWEKYGFSFVAPSSSVHLLMISNAAGGIGNDIVIDDIALRVCANKGSGFCPSK